MDYLALKEARKLSRARTLLLYKRINWQSITRNHIRREFERLLAEARASSYPLMLYLAEHEQPNEGAIQITCSPAPTGAVNRTSTFDFDSGNYRHHDTAVVEDGGALVASQSVSGFIHFVVYPRKSDRIQPAYNEILLFRPLDPTCITHKTVQKAIRRFLLILRVTSLDGGHSPSTWDRACLVWLRFQDKRFKYELTRSLLSMRNEWGKIFMAAVLAYLVGLLTGSK